MKNSVLYIDDENNNLISFNLQFKEYYNIFTSSSAKDGFELLKRNNIDVIIADQQMPEMTGVEFFEQVHKEFPHIPRLILTGFSDTETVIEGINKGKISHYLQKPLNKTLLKMAISNALKSTKLLKKNVQLAKDLKIANRNLKTQYKQLEISAKRLSNAQALAHIGNWELDHSKNKLTWSDEIYRIFELDPKKFKATYEAFLKNIHPEDREMVDKAFIKSLKTKKPYEIIHRLKLKNGTIKYVNEKCTTEFDKNGNSLFSHGTIQDITKHRKAEIALRKNEQNLQLIHNTIGEVLFQIQVEPNDRFTFLSVNNAFLTTIEITEEQVIGKTIEEFIPEPSLTLALENYKTAIQEKRVVRWEETSVYPSGEKIGDVTITPAFDEDGNCTHLIGTIYDITELKGTLEKLKNSEEKYYGMIQNLMEGFYSSQLDGKLLDYNPEFIRILGLEPDKDHTGIELPNFWQNPEDRKSYLKKFIKNGFIKNYRIHAKKLDGEKIICNINALIIKDKAGKPKGIEGTFMDITKSLHAEEEIKKLNEELEERVKQRTKELMHEKNFSDALINSLPGIFSLIDKDGNHIRWNKNHEEVTGYSQEEYNHMKAFDFFSEANQKIIWKEMAQLDTKDEVTVEVNLLTKNAKEIPYFFTGINVSINNEKYLAGMGFDISERKLAETKLRKKTEELEIFNKLMIDRELRIIEMKEEVNKLSHQLELKPVYPEVWKNGE